MEAMSEPGGEGNATNDHARRDIRTEIGMMSMNRIGETGFRFVRIDLEEENASLSLKSIAAVLVYKDAPYLGSFSCSDPLLNRIWDVGAYTVHLNMQEYIWDGIKRDRLVWVCLLYTSNAAGRKCEAFCKNGGILCIQALQPSGCGSGRDCGRNAS